MSDAFEKYRDLLRSFAPEALAALAAIAADRNAPEMTRVRAAKMILNLACGRPVVERVICEAEKIN